LHLHPAAAPTRLVHVEWFHDHARVERMLFDGVQEVRDGAFAPDRGRPGNGLALRREQARRHAVPSIGHEEQT
jgi:hypothetical protein